MAYCTKCGAQLEENSSFCPRCGQAAAGAPAANTAPAAPTASAGSGLTENVAGMLCYSVGWLTGLVFFLTDKRPSVRFHAAQSMVVFGGLHLISIIFGRGFSYGFGYGGFNFYSGFGLLGMLLGILNIVGFILWILLMVKAYQGEQFKVPVAAGIAESLARK